MPEREREVIAEQCREHPGLTVAGDQDLRVAGQQRLGPPGDPVSLGHVAAGREDVGLQADRHGLDPRRLDLGRRAFTPPGGGQRLVQVGAEAPDIGQLQIDHRPDADGTGVVGKIAYLGEPRRGASRQHVDGAQLVQRAQLPDAHAGLPGDVAVALERGPGRGQVARPLPAADDLERFQRYLGGPAALQPRCPSAAAFRQRPPGQRLGLDPCRLRAASALRAATASIRLSRARCVAQVSRDRAGGVEVLGRGVRRDHLPGAVLAARSRTMAASRRGSASAARSLAIRLCARWGLELLVVGHGATASSSASTSSTSSSSDRVSAGHAASSACASRSVSIALLTAPRCSPRRAAVSSRSTASAAVWPARRAQLRGWPDAGAVDLLATARFSMAPSAAQSNAAPCRAGGAVILEVGEPLPATSKQLDLAQPTATRGETRSRGPAPRRRSAAAASLPPARSAAVTPARGSSAAAALALWTDELAEASRRRTAGCRRLGRRTALGHRPPETGAAARRVRALYGASGRCWQIAIGMLTAGSAAGSPMATPVPLSKSSVVYPVANVWSRRPPT